MAFTIENVISEIRYFLGGVGEAVISDITLTSIIERVMNSKSLTFEDSDFCKTVYYSLLETLRYLIRSTASTSAASGGELKSLKEKVGNTEITSSFSEGNSSSDDWKSLLGDFQSNPSQICEELKDLAVSSYPVIHFGGVSKEERDRVNSNQDSFNGWDIKSPYRESLQTNTKKVN